MTTDDPLTGAALNRAIAEKLGWRDIRDVTPTEITWTGYLPPSFLVGIAPGTSQQGRHVPDWANDHGAALALCLEVAQAGEANRVLCIDYYEVWLRDDNHHEGYDAGDPASLATALARLALDALTE